MIRRLLLLSFLFFAVAANAQSGVSISPLVSFDFGSPLFINRAAGVLNPFGITPGGNSSGESYGVGEQISIPDLVGDIGLVELLEGIYNSGKFTFTGQPYSVSGIDRKLLLELGALWNAKPFAISMGPWVSQSISRNIYENDPNGMQIASGDSIASKATHVGVLAGIAWKIPDFPLRPEINTHLDLTELSQAGVNAWSVGISVTYSFGGAGHALAQPSLSQSEATPISPVTPRVRFLVNGLEAHGNPPLERVETHVKEYAMVDSANVSPIVTQWVEESYHLPHLTLSCRFDRKSAGYLMILKDSLRLMEKYFEGNANSDSISDTLINLEKDVAWNTVLSHLNTGESNRLIAELRTNERRLSPLSDTLILPPVDTTRAVRTDIKNQFRFLLFDNYDSFAGGKESLDLLLGKIKVLLDSNASITIFESPEAPSSISHSELLRRLHDTLGEAWASARHEVSSEAANATIIELEY